jgi:hypothetical protein
MVSDLAKPAARSALALGLAVLAALGLVLEILVVEEVLFSRCEYKSAPQSTHLRTRS